MQRFPRGLALGAVILATFLLSGCGKAKARTFEALDKHKADFVACELMTDWAPQTACRVKLRQVIVGEVEGLDLDKYDAYLAEWKKDHGNAAVEEAKKSGSGSTGSGSTGASGGGCPDGAECLNRCRSECEKKHGPMMDTAKMAACAKSGGKPADCVSKASNAAATSCFKSCRGI